ncbi:MAG: chemotaxis protein CheW [Chthoniobacteraceae bacterium]|nr:chemotaxis protein CheW [Chthoniobacteraceae bacterium]
MTRQFCVFLLDGQLFGVEVSLVQEVVRHQAMTRVPLAPPVIGGLINLRGQLVTAIDVRRLLNLAPLPEGRLPMNVVLHTTDGSVSLLVDDIDNVIEVDDSAFEEPPDTVHGRTRDLIQGVYKLEDRLLLVLNTEAVLHFEKAKSATTGR